MTDDLKFTLGCPSKTLTKIITRNRELLDDFFCVVFF